MWLKPWMVLAALVIVGGYVISGVDGSFIASIAIIVGYVLGVLTTADLDEEDS